MKNRFTGIISPKFNAAAIILAVTFAAAQFVNAAGTSTWTGATDQNWSTAGNWSAGTGATAPPATVDTALFGAGGTSGNSTTVNNIVNASTTIAALTYNQSGSSVYHVTQIPSGNTLSVSGTTTVGGLNADGSITLVSMTGAGTFAPAGNTLKVGNTGSSSTSTLNATLDMSALSNFVYNASGGTLTVAGSGSDARAGGVLNFAGVSNNVTVGTITFNTGSGNNSGFLSLIQFGGGTNIVNVGTMTVCQTKAQFATIQFLSGTPSTAGVKIRGVNGNSDDTSRATITLGDRNNTGGGNTDGEMLLNGHGVDIKAGTLTVGQDRTGSGSTAHAGVGVLQFDTGTVDATTINMAVDSSAGTASSATGTITVGANGTLVVGTGGLSLANKSGGGTAATGNLNISGGTVTCNGSITKGQTAATGNITFSSGGKLQMASGCYVGSASVSINAFTLVNSSILQFVVPSDGTVNAVVGTVTWPADDTTLTLNIAGLPGTATVGSTYHLIQFTTFSGTFNAPVVNLPSGYTGHLSKTSTTIDLVIDTAPAPAQSIVWQGTVSTGNWDTTTPNWTNSAGTAVTYNENDFVTFDDSAATNVVNLSATRSPGALTNNSSANYTIIGSGIGGSGSLTKQGSGTLTLDNNNNTYSGGTTISAGTLQIGNNDANSSLPSGAITMNGSLVLAQTNSYTIANVISGSGTLTINPGNTNAVVTLSGASTFTGSATVASGTLKIGNTFALGSSNGLTTVNSGATLDVNGTKVEDYVLVSGWGVASNGCLINSGASQQNAFTNITLVGDAAFGGPGDFAGSGNPGRWDIRGSNVKLNSGGQPYNLYKIGRNQFSLVAATVDSALGNIDIQNGQFAIETSTTGLGDPSYNCIVHAGANIELFNTFNSFTTYALNKNFIFYGNGVDTNVMVNSGGIYGTWSNVFIGPVILTNGDSVVAGGSGNASGVLFSNIVSGPGGFIVGGTRTSFTNYFTTNNTYTGNTTIRIGTLALVGNGSIANSANIAINGGAIFDVTGVSSSPYSIAGGQTLKSLNAGGTGNIVGAVTLDSGALLTLNYTNGSPSLNISSGALTLNDNAVTVTVASGPSLAEGSYKVISKGTGGSVDGSANGSVTINGAGAAHNGTLSISGSELFLNVGHAPTIANIVTNSVNSGVTMRIAISDLASAAGWNDADSDTISLSSVDATSANSVSVTKDSTFIYYNAPVTAEDHFNYVISDGTLTASGTVYVEAITSGGQTYNITGSTVNNDNSITLNGAGIPNRTNVIERATTLTPPIPWTPVGTNIIDGTGHWQFTDPSPTDPAFYRSVTQP